MNRLLVPRDTDGYQCGQDSEVIDKKYLVFFDLAKCADPLVPLNGCPTPQTCVHECPNTNFVHDIKTCNKDLAAYKTKLICTRHVNINTINSCSDVEKLINTEQCAKWYLKSEPCKLLELFLSISPSRMLYNFASPLKIFSSLPDCQCLGFVFRQAFVLFLLFLCFFSTKSFW